MPRRRTPTTGPTALAFALMALALLAACRPPSPEVAAPLPTATAGQVTPPTVAEVAKQGAPAETPAPPPLPTLPRSPAETSAAPAPALPVIGGEPSPTLLEPAARSTAAPTPAAPPSVAAPPTPTAVPPAASAQPAANTALWQRRGAEFAEGTPQGTAIGGDELHLAQTADGRFVANGTLLSPEYATQFPFDNAVLSWNASAPAGTSLRFELRARVGSTWTPWYVMGTWTAGGGSSQSGQSDQWAAVDVDTLTLRQPASAFQYRLTLATQDPTATPALRLLSVVYADLRRPLFGPPVQPDAGWARDLAVPAFSQLMEDPSIARAICSATSLAMVLNFYGVKKPVAEVAAGVRDRAAGIFGNWPLNTAYAAAQGLEAYVNRFYSMDQIRQEIAQGRPAIISIKFGPGELSSSLLSSTSGHLIVVRGFTPEGNVIVNDPWAPSRAEVRRVYLRKELESVWLRSGGIAYLVHPS